MNSKDPGAKGTLKAFCSSVARIRCIWVTLAFHGLLPPVYCPLCVGDGGGVSEGEKSGEAWGKGFGGHF